MLKPRITKEAIERSEELYQDWVRHEASSKDVQNKIAESNERLWELSEAVRKANTIGGSNSFEPSVYNGPDITALRRELSNLVAERTILSRNWEKTRNRLSDERNALNAAWTRVTGAYVNEILAEIRKKEFLYPVMTKDRIKEINEANILKAHAEGSSSYEHINLPNRGMMLVRSNMWKVKSLIEDIRMLMSKPWDTLAELQKRIDTIEEWMSDTELVDGIEFEVSLEDYRDYMENRPQRITLSEAQGFIST